MWLGKKYSLDLLAAFKLSFMLLLNAMKLQTNVEFLSAVYIGDVESRNVHAHHGAGEPSYFVFPSFRRLQLWG